MRFTAAVFLFLACVSAFAIPDFWVVFKAHYKPTTKAKCGYCHTTESGGARNPYGKALEAQLRGADEITVAMLQAVEGEDSDGDGMTNGDEIREGRMPGTSDAPAAPKVDAPLVPKHSYHPLIVHFPIGIYLFAAFLEFCGFRKKDPEMRRVALFGLWIGMLATLAGVTTGIIAMLRMALPIEGFLLIHLIAGLVTLALAFTVVGIRRGSIPTGSGYWALLTLSAIGIAVTGHYGAMMVWG